MDAIQFDPETVEKLKQIKRKLEVRDAKGEVVGYFVAPRRLAELENEWYRQVDMAKKLVSDEELDRAKNEEGVYTTEDVMKLLEKRS